MYIYLFKYAPFCDRVSSSCSDPSMVNAYMYQAAGTNGQPAPPPGPAPPTTSPPYSNYQPTPTQGYQVWLTFRYL